MEITGRPLEYGPGQKVLTYWTSGSSTSVVLAHHLVHAQYRLREITKKKLYGPKDPYLNKQELTGL